MSHLRQSRATFDARQGVARQSRKCDRACRTLRHGASHSRATRFRNRALLYSVRLWRASESRVKDARQNRRCDIGLRNITTFVHSLRHSKIRVFVKMRGLVKFVTISCAFRKCISNLLFTCKQFRRTTRVSCVSCVCVCVCVCVWVGLTIQVEFFHATEPRSGVKKILLYKWSIYFFSTPLLMICADPRSIFFTPLRKHTPNPVLPHIWAFEYSCMIISGFALARSHWTINSSVLAVSK